MNLKGNSFTTAPSLSMDQGSTPMGSSGDPGGGLMGLLNQLLGGGADTQQQPGGRGGGGYQGGPNRFFNPRTNKWEWGQAPADDAGGGGGLGNLLQKLLGGSGWSPAGLGGNNSPGGGGWNPAGAGGSPGLFTGGTPWNPAGPQAETPPPLQPAGGQPFFTGGTPLNTGTGGNALETFFKQMFGSAGGNGLLGMPKNQQ